MDENTEHNFLEGDQKPDVEGHIRVRIVAEKDDVEGHIRRVLAIDEEYDDVEGHVEPPRDLDIERV